MQQLEYYKLPGLENVYLEDSYVLEIVEEPTLLRFVLDVVLTEEHPHYQEPKIEEQYCYRQAWLEFSGIEDIIWVKKNIHPFTDATGSLDYGNIDVFYQSNTKYHIEGDWGIMDVTSKKCTLMFLE
ncbi:hypothetical protein PN466_05615 [Roseofilum reptotaenium CS-1145]|uniref:Uncharacterized protein n=1 Tax=Roseofilum reptotaenium AO1-A TaxID=1925591 RepID=A0A1L9QP38_9CYAN|nr:hypothetical protein [Roseofilum reptotaenium]MDB9516437.1 hypothetical protein [Roseofilum reptotaenium CS-1145]OJJ24435.1 hypothetical protein BI308_16630 [Roseofilum reptotaenium AO1-A]